MTVTYELASYPVQSIGIFAPVVLTIGARRSQWKGVATGMGHNGFVGDGTVHALLRLSDP